MRRAGVRDRVRVWVRVRGWVWVRVRVRVRAGVRDRVRGSAVGAGYSTVREEERGLDLQRAWILGSALIIVVVVYCNCCRCRSI